MLLCLAAVPESVELVASGVGGFVICEELIDTPLSALETLISRSYRGINLHKKKN